MENHFLLPQSRLDEFNANFKELKGILLEIRSKPQQLNDWISELDAQTLLGLKETSLWALRKKKQLVFSKIGARTFYSLKSIEKLLSKNQE
jgi:hypothetical protein